MSKLVQIPQSEYDPAAFARFAPGAGFTLDNARALMWLSQLTYETYEPSQPQKIAAVGQLWSFASLTPFRHQKVGIAASLYVRARRRAAGCDHHRVRGHRSARLADRDHGFHHAPRRRHPCGLPGCDRCGALGHRAGDRAQPRHPKAAADDRTQPGRRHRGPSGELCDGSARRQPARLPDLAARSQFHACRGARWWHGTGSRRPIDHEADSSVPSAWRHRSANSAQIRQAPARNQIPACPFAP